MDAKEIRKAVKQGKSVDIEALCDCIENLTMALALANKTIADLTKKIEELSKSNRIDQAYSVSAFERAQELAAAKNGKKPKRSKNSTTKPGRKLNQSKLQAAIRTEQVLQSEYYPRPLFRVPFSAFLSRTPAYSGKPISPFPLSNFRSNWSQGYRRLFQTSKKVSESSALARSWPTNAQADL